MNRHDVFSATNSRPERVLESKLTFPIAHIPGIDLRLSNPPAHRLRAVPQLDRDPEHGALCCSELLTKLEHETNSLVLLILSYTDESPVFLV